MNENEKLQHYQNFKKLQATLDLESQGSLFWPTERKKCSSDGEILLKFETEGREFPKYLRSLEQFIQIVKGKNNFR